MWNSVWMTCSRIQSQPEQHPRFRSPDNTLFQTNTTDTHPSLHVKCVTNPCKRSSMEILSQLLKFWQCQQNNPGAVSATAQWCVCFLCKSHSFCETLPKRDDLCSRPAANIDWNHTGLWSCSCRAAPADQHLDQSAQEHLQAHLKNRRIYLPELRRQSSDYWSIMNTNPTHSGCSPPPICAWPLQPHLPSPAQPVLWPELTLPFPALL